MKHTLTHCFVSFFVLFISILTPTSVFAQSAAPIWTGSITCQLDDEEQGAYQRQEIQTWTLSGASTSAPGSMPIYSATWTVQAQGQLLRQQGPQATSIQWMANVPAPGGQPPTVNVVITVRASDNRLMIKQWSTLISAPNAINGRRQLFVNGVPQGQPATFVRPLPEWAFPLIEASPTDTMITGSAQIQTEGTTAELTHRYGSSAPSAMCQWRLTKGGQNLGTGPMGNATQNQNQQNPYGNSGTQNNNNPNGMGGSGSQNPNQQSSQTGSTTPTPASNPNCDSPTAVQKSFEAMKANIKSSYDALIQGTTDQAQIASLTQQEQRTLASLTSQEQHDMQKAAADGCTGVGHSGNTQTQSNPPVGSNPPTGGGQNQTGSGSSPTTTVTTPTITSISPKQVTCGQVTSFQVTGQNTHFAQGTTTADFGPGFQQMTLSVGGPTSFYAHEYVHAVANAGPHTVTVTTGSEVLTTSFMVNAPCNPGPQQAFLYLNQNSGPQGAKNLVVQLSGQAAQRAYFVQGVTTADFGPGVTANLTVNSPTSATAVLNIDPSATLGPRDVSLNTAGESITASQGFTVTLAPGSTPLVNLTTSYVGNGSGQVTVTPAGISCGANCSQYPSGTTLTLTATPNSGSKFMAFGGGVCATTNPCSFAITTSTAVTGIFHLGDSATSGPVNLTASSSGTGSGSVAMTPVGTACGTNCMQYNPGTAVTVIAVPNSGSTFSSFSGGGCASTNPCSFTITATTTVAATFTLNSSSSGSSGSTGIPMATGSTHVASMGLLTGVSPATNSGQQNVTVTLTGQLTNFVDGKTTVNFVRTSQPGPSVSVNAAVMKNLSPSGPPPVQVGTVKVNSKTSATVTLSMNPSTAAGTYSITATTPTSSGTPEVVTLNDGFTVTTTPTLNITPGTIGNTGMGKNTGSSQTPAAPASAKYRVTITGLMCMKHISSNDAVYAAAVVRQYDRRNNQNTMFTNLNTWVYGDINGMISQRKQAGTRGPGGGIGDGDLVPTGFMPGSRDAMPTPQVNNLLPLTLWEGTLTDGVDALVISPSLWINYGDNPLFSTWNQNQDSFNNSILMDPRVQNQINNQTLGTIVLGPGANVSGSVAQATVHDAATMILDTILVIPFVELQGGPSHDRPVGLADANPSDPTSSTILPNTTLVLTREMIEKRLGSGSWMMMPIDLNDTAHSFTGLIGADRPGEYQMFIQIERQ